MPHLLLPDSKPFILLDRMLVKISSTKAQNLSPVFDESIHRTTCDLEYEEWGEFMVAWRKDLIEIYEDYVSTTECCIVLKFSKKKLTRIRHCMSGQSGTSILPMLSL
jgi:hypothetical protein